VIVNLELGDAAITAEPARSALRVCFGLPAGSYATVAIDCLLANIVVTSTTGVDANKLC
jgi:tRNA(Glu) U13 pseudouridine synthase TruD